jgi:hypothetical protein
MFNKKIVLSALAVTLLATSGISFSREAGEVRGEGKGHKNSVDVNSIILAREAGEVRGEGKGHKNSVDVNSIILARELTEAPRGADNNNHRQRGRNKNSVELNVLA